MENQPTEDISTQNETIPTEQPPQTTPQRIERKYDPEKRRQYTQAYKARLKERAQQGDEKAKQILEKQNKYFVDLIAKSKETKLTRKKFIEEKKELLKQADEKLEELKKVKDIQPTIKVEPPEDYVKKEKYKKLKKRVNELEQQQSQIKPKYNANIYNSLFGN